MNVKRISNRKKFAFDIHSIFKTSVGYSFDIQNRPSIKCKARKRMSNEYRTEKNYRLIFIRYSKQLFDIHSIFKTAVWYSFDIQNRPSITCKARKWMSNEYRTEKNLRLIFIRYSKHLLDIHLIFKTGLASSVKLGNECQTNIEQKKITVWYSFDIQNSCLIFIRYSKQLFDIHLIFKTGLASRVKLGNECQTNIEQKKICVWYSFDIQNICWIFIWYSKQA